MGDKILLGLMGKKRCGKDTVAKILIYNYSFTSMRFADPIKEMCKIMFGWGYNHIEGDLKEVIDPRWGISPRQAMQYIGTEFAQFNLGKAYPNFYKTISRRIWSERFRQEYVYCDYDFVVVPDTRFKHEVDCIHDLGGKVIEIVRPNTEDKLDNHASEKELESLIPDYTILNDSTINDLEDKVLSDEFRSFMGYTNNTRRII